VVREDDILIYSTTPVRLWTCLAFGAVPGD